MKKLKAYKTEQGAWQLNWSEGGKQKTLYIGKSETEITANEVACLVDEIRHCRKSGGSMSGELKRKLRKIPRRIVKSMEHKGLFESVAEQDNLSDLCTLHYPTKSGLKERTQKNYRSFYRVVDAWFGLGKKSGT